MSLNQSILMNKTDGLITILTDSYVTELIT